MKFKQTQKSIALAALLILVTSCGSQDPTPAKITQSNIKLAVASLDARANELLTKTGVPGLAIAVVHNNKVIYTKGFGVRNVETKTTVDANTVFQLASMSKPLAATVVAAVVSQGRVKWDDPVAKYLPGFTLSNADVGAKVTIADMFAHRSGLPGQAGDDLELFGCSRSEVIFRLRFLPLNPYQTTYNYTNFGLTAGAVAVAAKEGMPWEVLAKKELYDPLWMASTSSTWSDYNNRANKADLHVKNTQGNWVVSARQPDPQSPAGGVSSSVSDIAKWMMFELNNGFYNGKQLISKKALQETWQPIMKLPTTALSPNDYYGLGIAVGYDEMGRLHLRHSGGFTAGASTTFDMLPSERLGIVILTNGYQMGIPETIAQEFYDIVEFGKIQTDRYTALSTMFSKIFEVQGTLDEKDRPTHPNPVSAGFVGIYKNDYYGKAVIDAKGDNFQLTLTPCSKDTTYTLSHWDGNTFAYPVGNELVTILASVKFTPGHDANPATILVESLDTNGLGTLTKVN